jgi:thymidylate synthase (FAD)
MDALDLVPVKEIQCLNKGFVKLIDVMPRIVPDGQTCDYAIAQMARVSYGAGTKSVSEDKGLIRYLLRHSHTSPIEAIDFKFAIKMPLFIARQMFRHRTSSVNEISGRFSVMKDEFYIPAVENLRKQSTTNKQGGDELLEPDIAQDFVDKIDLNCKDCYSIYLQMLDAGISREQARMILPLNLYTEFYWKQNLHNLLHLLALRADSHAQQEIRAYAEAILKLISPLVPWTIEAWNDYHPMRGAMKLTSLEKDALFNSDIDGSSVLDIDSKNQREAQEWCSKREHLFKKII